MLLRLVLGILVTENDDVTATTGVGDLRFLLNGMVGGGDIKFVSDRPSPD